MVAPGIGSAIGIGIAGATAQTGVDYLAGEGNAVTTSINYLSSVAPVGLMAGSEYKYARQVIRYGSGEGRPLIETGNFFSRFEKGNVRVVGKRGR